MNNLKTMVLMQLKDKLDLSFIRSTKTLIRKIVFTLLKFVAVAAATYLIRFLLGLIIFDNSDTPQIMMVLLTFLLGFSIISCTVGLVKSLYFSDDNKVLITLPVENNVIFLSKLIVYYLYELAREFLFIVPIIIGCGLYSINILTFWFIPWTMLMMVLVPMVPVLLGGLLSIPSLFIARFVSRYSVVKFLLVLTATGLFAWLFVYVVGLLPEDIDLINDGPQWISSIKKILLGFERTVLPIAYLVYLFTGKKGVNLIYNVFSGRTFIIFAVLILLIALLFFVVYFLSRPLFFKMMSKSFEFEKNFNVKPKKNTPHTKWQTFLLKELRLCILNTEVSSNFIVIYILIPLLIFLLNSLYAAMNTRLKGDVMAYAFNILIMLLPMLASNSLIATLYSKEGRAGYIKKTKPINVLMPLVAKIFFFALLSIPSIAATVAVFGTFSSQIFKWYDLLLLGLMLLFFQYGHIAVSAMFDIMNPQNEQYATVGESAQNPNENKSTILAFSISIVIALFSYLLLSESVLTSGSPTIAMVKLCGVALVFCVFTVNLFVKSIKAFYYEK